MRLTRIDIRSLPGVRPGFQVDSFDPGANFVTGPNAIGKSSLVRALRYLLREPRSDDPLDLSLSAEFRDGDTTWTVHRERGDQPAWERDGQRAEAPPLPPVDAIGSHLVTVEDLVHIQGKDDQALATALRRELHGGFDLPAIRNDEVFKRGLRIGRHEQGQLNNARSTLADVERKHAELRRQQETLPGLESEIDQAQAAGIEVRRLEVAEELLEAVREHAGFQRELQQFPNDMEKLAGKETARLEDIEQRIERHQERRRELEHELQQARRTLADSGLAEQCPDEQELELARDRLVRLETLEGQITEQREVIAKAETRRDNARARLGRSADAADSLPKVEAEAVDRARELARNFDKAERERDEFGRLLETLKAARPEDDDQKQLRRGADLLREWLSAPTQQASSGNWKPTAIVGGIGAVAAVTGGLIGEGWMAIVGGILMVIAVILPYFVRANGATQTDRADGIRESYLSLQIDKPDRWERQAVLQHLHELDNRLATLTVEQERRQQVAEWQRHLQRAEEQLTRLEEQRQELARELGFDPALIRQHDDFLQRVRDWQQAVDEVDTARTRLTGLDSGVTELREAVGTFLGQFPGTPEPVPERHDELAAAFRELRQRSQTAMDAAATIRTHETALARQKEELASETESRVRLYRDAGLEDGQRRELEQRLDRLKDWGALQQKLDQTRGRIGKLKSQLEQRPDLVELAESGDADQIAGMLQQASERHERLDEYKTEKVRIESDIRNTEKRHDREAELAEVQACETALAQRREEKLNAEAAHFLLDEIENEYRSEQQPPVLKSAREHFSRFTHNQWRLELDESDQGSFRALDTEQQVWRQPGELSTATRMQLLLALRLAHAEASEQGVEGNRSRTALPLIIDEALTTSDHERASVILNNLTELAERGRQIIYLAAGESEYQLWQHATGQSPKRIDLGEIRNRTRASEPPSFEVPETPTIPTPEGLAADEYARLLEVPAIDPREEAGRVHVFHLLHEELELLHHLMADWRIRTLGQLESLLEPEAGRHAIEDDGMRERLAQRCRITRDWIAAWRIGHGKPVNRAVLEAADGITPATIDRVSEKADEVDHDAGALIRALEAGEVERYWANQLRRLEEYLLDHGYLDPRDPLMADQRRAHLLRQLGGQTDIGELHAHVDWLEAASTSDKIQ